MSEEVKFGIGALPHFSDCAAFDNPETTIRQVHGILAVRGFSALMLLKIQDLLCSGSARHKILMPRARPKEYLSLCPVSNC